MKLSRLLSLFCKAAPTVGPRGKNGTGKNDTVKIKNLLFLNKDIYFVHGYGPFISVFSRVIQN